ncbi:MAG: response regulator [Moorellales bacterium]
MDAECPEYSGKPVVLVVDDQPGIRELLFEVLQDARWEVRLAANAREALTEVATNPPALAIIDLRLPGMNGLELLREMRRRQFRGQVVVLSAYSDTDAALEAKNLGAAYWFSKPFDLDELVGAVEELLGEAPKRSELTC